jgi:tRNA nucleotidyltransferase (CCA-adding enzyme)
MHRDSPLSEPKPDDKLLNLQAYVVGGAVRDELLGLPVSDRDWVVVGSDPEAMLHLGFRPVGKDFPVFIHPVSGEEYALARTERKTAKGYHGFSFHAAADVTLEQDLSRRDLTINAIAKTSDGNLVDPYGGIADLRAKVFRHVSDAFQEDPVRILRLARFAARFSDFSIHRSTDSLMKAMVDAGEVDALVAERVWQEFAKGLMENSPSRMLKVLQDCGALPKLLGPIDAVYLAKLSEQIDGAAKQSLSLHERFALLAPAVTGDRLAAMRLPAEVADLSQLYLSIGNEIVQISLEKNVKTAVKTDVKTEVKTDVKTYANLLQRCDVIRRPQRFECLLRVLCIANVTFVSSVAKWRNLALAYQSVDAGEIAALINARSGADQARSEAIKQAVAQAREQKIAQLLEQSANTPG